MRNLPTPRGNRWRNAHKSSPELKRLLHRLMTTLYRAWNRRERAFLTIIKISMHQKLNERVVDLNPQETSEWVEALDQMIDEAGPDRATYLLERLMERAAPTAPKSPSTSTRLTSTRSAPRRKCPIPATAPSSGASRASSAGTPWPWWCGQQVRRRHRRPHLHLRVAGHAARGRASTTSSTASYGDQPGDLVYFQGHASPGRLCARVPRRPSRPKSTCRISATSCASSRVCRPIRTRG